VAQQPAHEVSLDDTASGLFDQDEEL